MQRHKISLDGGALTNNESQQYGNYVFTKQLLRAIALYDQGNDYFLYLQNKINTQFARNITNKVLLPQKGWLKGRVSIEEILRPKEVFLALNQALPIYTPAKQIAFCHGLAPLYYPKLYPDSAAKLKQQALEMIYKADKVLVSSEIIKKQFVEIFSLTIKQANKIIVLPFGIFPTMKNAKRYKKKKILLFVGSIHPIKNSQFAIEAFLKLQKEQKYSAYKLLLIGISKNNLKKEQQNNPGIICMGHQPYEKLGKFYQEAECLLSTSLYESFNFPIIEALVHNTPVVALETAVIPELSPFVHATRNDSHKFLKAIKKILNKPSNINSAKVCVLFSWEKYIHSLLKLYED